MTIWLQVYLYNGHGSDIVHRGKRQEQNAKSHVSGHLAGQGKANMPKGNRYHKRSLKATALRLSILCTIFLLDDQTILNSAVFCSVIQKCISFLLMSPGHKRQMAEKLVSGDRCTARAACRHIGLNRSTYAFRAKEADAWEAKLKGALRRKSNEHPELGYSKITRLLKQEGWQVGARNVQRLRRELGLRIPAKKPKRRRQGISTGLPTKGKHRGHVWTWDFVHDTTKRGGKLRMLNNIDEYTRECLCIHVDRQINAGKVKKIFSKLIDEHGAPEHIRSGTGSEFIERGLREWLAENEIMTLYIEAGCPWQNGYIESFNVRLREECLNREELWTLTEARV